MITWKFYVYDSGSYCIARESTKSLFGFYGCWNHSGDIKGLINLILAGRANGSISAPNNPKLVYTVYEYKSFDQIKDTIKLFPWHFI